MPASRLIVVSFIWKQPGRVQSPQDRRPPARSPRGPPDVGTQNTAAFWVSTSSSTLIDYRKPMTPAPRKSAAPLLFYFIFSVFQPFSPSPPSRFPGHLSSDRRPFSDSSWSQDDDEMRALSVRGLVVELWPSLHGPSPPHYTRRLRWTRRRQVGVFGSERTSLCYASARSTWLSLVNVVFHFLSPSPYLPLPHLAPALEGPETLHIRRPPSCTSCGLRVQELLAVSTAAAAAVAAVALPDGAFAPTSNRTAPP
ncbi:hypothetical protein GLOTRDRAFT_129279 [Gloeophyllum trabeum ATCC 11539]|uniref:Uncharacterized protein n=1 Tax=Gloeophyllum trabeum (strain ATCC 11539 / FP-39264 / Madison 617) TaxID=670483 RepID=S7RQ02_GLOTA|nr:uncharacterized protein GLOTRDRAFT_129279 [Gloeophyllum trabeum ATCC 11539]EPQ54969.1 hypothetical protein GLOTRDRAFT_129279 [Gloeophyllum trabeum ATCC 11539]